MKNEDTKRCNSFGTYSSTVHTYGRIGRWIPSGSTRCIFGTLETVRFAVRSDILYLGTYLL